MPIHYGHMLILTPNHPGATPSIEVEELVKVYPGGRPALGGITFSVAPGEVFGLLGPNGSGKTTTVRILVTLLRRTRGMARVAGFDTDTEAARVRPLIGYAGQFTGVDDDLTASENLIFSGFYHGIPHQAAWKRATDLLEAFALAEFANVRASRLSGGLRRRLDLAQALVHRPRVLFLDEPSTGLDPQSRNALWERIGELSRQGTAVLLTTQHLEEADRVCGRVAIVDRGRLVRLGTPEELKHDVGGGKVTLTLAQEGEGRRAAHALLDLDGVVQVEPGESAGSVVVHVADARTSVVTLLQRLSDEGIRVAAVDQQRASLDDVFLRYTGERPQVEARMEGAVSSVFAAAHGRRRH
jgi:ABC-2 type transport system ATP-binding protein